MYQISIYPNVSKYMFERSIYYGRERRVSVKFEIGEHKDPLSLSRAFAVLVIGNFTVEEEGPDQSCRFPVALLVYGIIIVLIFKSD